MNGSALRSDEPGVLPSALLPPVVNEASAAILVVDLRVGEVTFANQLAQELVPGMRLPVGLDEWSVAAGLEDLGGSDIPADADPHPGPDRGLSLLRVANGEPVLGEAVTAARPTAASHEREPLWVLGLPMSEAPEPFSSLALIAFMPLRNAQLVAGAQESVSLLRDRAVLATRVSFTISDPSRPDNPLVWVNPAFSATTGYGFDEVVGQNCRFLQGPDTDRRVVGDIRRSLEQGRPITTTLLNYRKDGAAFWNELSISPVFDQDGRLTHFVGVQADVTARVDAQHARDEALQQAEIAAGRFEPARRLRDPADRVAGGRRDRRAGRRRGGAAAGLLVRGAHDRRHRPGTALGRAARARRRPAGGGAAAAPGTGAAQARPAARREPAGVVR